MKIVFSWDDGAPEDQKLFELHEKYEIPGIFFVPNRNREGRPVLSEQMIHNNESELISFGGHTENHVFLTEIPLEDAEKEIRHNQQYLEDLLGHEIVDFCLPGGRYNQDIVDMARKYYKTIRTADTMNFACEGELIKPTFHFYDRGRKSLIGNSVRNSSIRQLLYILTHPNYDYFTMMRKLIDNEKNSDSIVKIWGHSWEIEECSLWKELDSFFAHIRQNYWENCCKYGDAFKNFT